MNKEKIKSTISALGFTYNSKNENIYSKLVGEIDYELVVDFHRKKIDYGPEIKRGDDSTTHLQASENLVVLECVNRLIEKGYKPGDLTLEKKWKLGRTAKSGKADITVKGKDGKTLLIIECKTWGTEYEKELERMKSNGGQLFSYYQQDKNTRYLCLYASREKDGNIEKNNALLKVEDTTEEKVKQGETSKVITYEQAKNISEMLEVWKLKTSGKQTFLHTGLFEEDIEPYNPGYIPLKISDLKEFKSDDKGKVFNEFEEILRHNNISDRSNAFNRIISLILAKIVDENKNDDAITDFQVKEGIDDAESLLERLQSLYSRAMRDYLDEEVIDYKLEDIEREIANFPRQTAKETLYRIYKELKFYQNNEFAFKEVYNKKLFEENAKVLEEVIRLFQEYKFKYDQKAQFLGDFFELMLESGYKQTEGQFFTPTPITRFIISSIPLRSIIDEKIQNGENSFLPKVIDFACGSGHFLTEAIEEISNTIQELDENELEDEQNIRELKRYKESMRWAQEYIFGVEKDYRLARTSQVACFMHGDGDANVIFGDGLEKHERLDKDGTFDVLIANPPYTIKDFKKHLKVNPQEFELWEHVTSDSDDIEVFFIERMKQLLRPGGMAGIILPSSILSNAGTYTKAREIILKYFEVKAIVEFGSSTFGATGTNTVTLFLKKRDEDFVTNCRFIAEDFILENKERDGDFLNSKELFENYIEDLELGIEDYKSFTAREPNEEIQSTEFYRTYKTWFYDLKEVQNLKTKDSFKALEKEEQEKRLNSMFFDLVLEMEKEKFFYYLLTHRIEEDPENYGWYEDETEEGKPMKIAYPQKRAIPQMTLNCKTGNKISEQRKFLGYKFSRRRGYKGIDYFGNTMMYDEKDKLSSKKVNSYIFKNFLDQKYKIDDSLIDNLKNVRLRDCINFGKLDFDKVISSSNANPVIIESKHPFMALKKVLSTIEIGNRPKGGVAGISDGIPSLGGEHLDTDGSLNLEDMKFVPNEFYEKSTKGKIEIGDILICKDGALTGKVALVKSDFPYQKAMINEHVYIIRANELVNQKYLFHFLNSDDGQTLLKSKITGQAQGGLNQTNLRSIEIPISSKEIQKKIVDDIEEIIEEKKNKEKQIQENKIDIYNIIESEVKRKKVSEVGTLKRSKINPSEFPERRFNYLGLAEIESDTGNILSWEPSIGASIKSAKNQFKPGNVLYGKLRPYLNKVVIPDFEGICSTDILVIETKFPIILQHILLSKKFVDAATEKMSGANLPRIKVKDLLRMEIDYPNDPESISQEIQKLEGEIRKQEEFIQGVEDKKKEILIKYLEE